MWLTLLWYSLYCSGLEPNPQYLWGMPVCVCVCVCIICLNPAGTWQRQSSCLHAFGSGSPGPYLCASVSMLERLDLQCHWAGSSIESLLGCASRPGGCRHEWILIWERHGPKDLTSLPTSETTSASSDAVEHFVHCSWHFAVFYNVANGIKYMSYLLD